MSRLTLAPVPDREPAEPRGEGHLPGHAAASRREREQRDLVGLYVRGGTPDQNLVSYDGFTVYHVDHLFGYFTAFNMEAVDEVELHKGAYDARFGGRLSSVLELRGKSGPKDRFSGSVTASLLSAGGSFSAPLGSKGSVLLAGRRSFQSGLYNDILGMFGSETGGVGPRMIGGGPSGGGPAEAASSRKAGCWASTRPRRSPTSTISTARSSTTSGPKDRFELSLYGGTDNLDNSRSMEMPSFSPRFGSETTPTFTISGTIDTNDVGRWSNRAGEFLVEPALHDPLGDPPVGGLLPIHESRETAARTATSPSQGTRARERG